MSANFIIGFTDDKYRFIKTVCLTFGASVRIIMVFLLPVQESKNKMMKKR